MRKKGINIKCNCEECQNIVYVKPFEVSDVLNGLLRKFCSKSCSNKTTKNKKRTGTEKKCKNCNKLFYTQKNQHKYQFCSHTCSSEFKKGRPITKIQKRITIICIHCNNKFIVQEYRKYSAKYCSIECSHLHSKLPWMSPRYNPDSISKIEEFGKKNGFNFQHALNGGEIKIKNTKYFVDGYDKVNNVVIEYDEPHHFDKNGNLKVKDLIRQNKIIEELNCTFIRLNYKNQIKIYGQTNVII